MGSSGSERGSAMHQFSWFEILNRSREPSEVLDAFVRLLTAPGESVVDGDGNFCAMIEKKSLLGRSWKLFSELMLGRIEERAPAWFKQRINTAKYSLVGAKAGRCQAGVKQEPQPRQATYTPMFISVRPLSK
jgi:hypothetical protein